MAPTRSAGTSRVAIIGAGPIGLEAALEAAARGWKVTVYEAGRVGEHLLRYGETVLFTPFGMNVTVLGRERLEAAGRRLPSETDLLSALELVERYFAPLALLPELRDSIRERTRVTHVARDGFTKTRTSGALGETGREGRPFLIRVEGPDGSTRFESADAVIDASGVYGQPNGTGPGGLPALGEERLGDRVERHAPPSAAHLRERYASRRILLLGDGHSAATTLRMLDDLVRASGDAAAPRVDWVCRDRDGAAPFVGVPDDPLPARRELANEANRIARSAAWLTTHRGATVVSYECLTTGAMRVTLSFSGGERTLEIDRVLALVGYRPDLSMTRELQVHHCYASEGPMKLASAILSASASPGSDGDCLAQVSHGPESLRNPEPGFYIVGAKSYGRNTSFLLSLGHRQIQDVLLLMGEPARSGSPLETAPSTSA